MSRTLPRPRSFSPGKSVCEIMALICGEGTECFSSLEAGILAQQVRMSTSKKLFSGITYHKDGRLMHKDLKKASGERVHSSHPLDLCGVAGGFRRGCRGLFFPLDRNQFRNARLLHRNTVKNGTHLHSLAIVRDYDELSLRAHLGEHLVKTPDVGFVQRRVHFVEDAERAGLVTEHGDQQCQRRERFFTAGEQKNILQT